MKTSILSISAMLLASAASSSTPRQSSDQGKPNVLFIVVDDLNDWIGPYGGHPQTKTPNIDRLASSGVTFMNAQCPATVCGPSRSALLTGLRPTTTGVYGNAQNLRDSEVAAAVPTISQYFSQNGYYSLSTGKIFHKHRTKEGMDHGQWAFDLWEEEKGGFPIDKSKLPLSQMPSTGLNNVEMDWGPTTVGKEETQDWISAKWAAQKFQEDFDKPFFMMLGITRPHLSWYVPQEYFDRFDLESIKVADYRLDDLDDILTPDGKKKFEPSRDFVTIQKNDKFKEVTRAYLACISYVDDCIGVVMDGLEKSKYKDNTIIVFIGDHGWFLGEKLRFRKTHLWEESCRTPMIMKLPENTKAVQCSRPVSFMDLYPTLASLCKLPDPQHCEGRNIVPLLKNPNKKWYPALTTMGYGNHSVRSERYRYNVWNDGTEELYDHDNDPMEWNNLINNPKYNKVVKEHKEYLPKINAKDAPFVNATIRKKDVQNE